ncbi:hypothetical protein WG66_016645 [Moniliophthora roreri]|nr:hypothetical protein WG66_016645 [Moniliophthora roreri]
MITLSTSILQFIRKNHLLFILHIFAGPRTTDISTEELKTEIQYDQACFTYCTYPDDWGRPCKSPSCSNTGQSTRSKLSSSPGPFFVDRNQ